MMIHPSYKEMISKINEGQDMDEAPLVTSRYSIVIAAARRARQLIAGDEPMVFNRDNEKALSTAIKELYEDQVHILPKDAKDEEASAQEELSADELPEEADPEEASGGDLYAEEPSGDEAENADDTETDTAVEEETEA